MLSNSSTFYEEKAKRHLYVKYAVAFRAALFLEEGDALSIDAGTSLTPIAKILKAMAEQYTNFSHFTIMTHNRGAFDSLIDARTEARVNLFQTGGRYDRDLNASFGNQAESAYENYHPKWVFLGQSGIDSDQGLFCHGNTEELSLKRIIFSKPAYTRVIVSDYTKLGIPGGLCFGSSDRLTDNVAHCVLITNNPRNESEPHEADWNSVLERFERQTSILSDTHKVKIVETKFALPVQSANSFTIQLERTDPPVGGAEWMGVGEGNRIVVQKEGAEWEVKEIAVQKYDSIASLH
jgi:DeoR/GlpR family transcriptional regulator of sugar metabolism